MSTRILAVLWLSLLPGVISFYLPGAAPHNYAEGDTVELFVNALTPMRLGNHVKIVSRCSFIDFQAHNSKYWTLAISHKLSAFNASWKL